MTQYYDGVVTYRLLANTAILRNVNRRRPLAPEAPMAHICTQTHVRNGVMLFPRKTWDGYRNAVFYSKIRRNVLIDIHGGIEHIVTRK